MKNMLWKTYVALIAIPILIWWAIQGAAQEVRIGLMELRDDWKRHDRREG